jgi:hypothetical protein
MLPPEKKTFATSRAVGYLADAGEHRIETAHAFGLATVPASSAESTRQPQGGQVRRRKRASSCCSQTQIKE